MKGLGTKSQINFQRWSAIPLDAHAITKEMQLQHKRQFDEKPPYGIPARQFDKAPFSSATTSSEHGMIPVQTQKPWQHSNGYVDLKKGNNNNTDENQN